jgi:4-hydroxybenzoate polyprenyltransferase
MSARTSTPRTLRAFDYVFLTRPTSLLPLWTFLLAGARAGAAARGTTLPILFPPFEVAIALASMTGILAGGFIINQIRDADADRLNRKCFLIPEGIVSIRSAWIEFAALWAAATVLALLLPGRFVWVLLGSAVLAVTYSAPPVRAKARFPLDLVWNALGFGVLATAAGWAAVAEPSARTFLLGSSYGLATAGVIASTTIPDVPGDARLSVRTTGVVIGEAATSVLAIALVGAAAVIGGIARDPLGLFGPLLSLPLLVRAHATRTRDDRIAANQVAVAVFALIVGVRLPYLLVLFALVYLGSRLYYAARFGLTYPETGVRSSDRA